MINLICLTSHVAATPTPTYQRATTNRPASTQVRSFGNQQVERVRLVQEPDRSRLEQAIRLFKTASNKAWLTFEMTNLSGMVCLTYLSIPHLPSLFVSPSFQLKRTKELNYRAW